MPVPGHLLSLSARGRQVTTGSRTATPADSRRVALEKQGAGGISCPTGHARNLLDKERGEERWREGSQAYSPGLLPLS